MFAFSLFVHIQIVPKSCEFCVLGALILHATALLGPLSTCICFCSLLPAGLLASNFYKWSNVLNHNSDCIGLWLKAL